MRSWTWLALWACRAKALAPRWATIERGASSVVEYRARVATAFEAARRARTALVIRDAAAVFDTTGVLGRLDVDELSGLALDDGVRSRLVEGATKRVALGPFDEAALRALGERDWTLLVNDAERHVPEVQQLRRDFGRLVASALHEWRHDDAMVSIATPGGGVGPHVDSSDVALLQARGRRRWAIETTPLSAAAALQRDDPSTGARCLTDFRPDAEWVLEPGDCLFVPARVPHDGQALGAAQSNAQDQLCVTVSLGIRGFDGASIGARWLEDCVGAVEEQPASGDALLELALEPGASTTEMQQLKRRVSRHEARLSPDATPNKNHPFPSEKRPREEVRLLRGCRTVVFSSQKRSHAVLTAARRDARRALEVALDDDLRLARALGELATAPRERALTDAAQEAQRCADDALVAQLFQDGTRHDTLTDPQQLGEALLAAAQRVADHRDRDGPDDRASYRGDHDDHDEQDDELDEQDDELDDQVLQVEQDEQDDHGDDGEYLGLDQLDLEDPEAWRLASLLHAAGARFAHAATPGGAVLCANGFCHTAPSALAPLVALVTSSPRLSPRALAPFVTDPEALALLATLLKRGDLLAVARPTA